MQKQLVCATGSCRLISWQQHGCVRSFSKCAKSCLHLALHHAANCTLRKFLLRVRFTLVTCTKRAQITLEPLWNFTSCSSHPFSKHGQIGMLIYTNETRYDTIKEITPATSWSNNVDDRGKFCHALFQYYFVTLFATNISETRTRPLSSRHLQDYIMETTWLNILV